MLTSSDFLSSFLSIGINMLVSIFTYLFTAFGIYSMGKKLGVSNPWLSFIPFANVYAFGKIAEHYIKRDGRPSAKFSKILLIFQIIISVLALVLVVAILVNFVLEAISNPDINAYFESEEFAENGLFTFVLPAIFGLLGLFVLSIVYLVINYVALWRIFAIFDPDTATLYLVLSIFVSILQPIFIFILRNREPQIFAPQPIMIEQEKNIM